MNKKYLKYLPYIIFYIALFFMGLITGKTFFQKKSASKTVLQTQLPVHEFTLLNPILGCPELQRINMLELNNFRPVIEKYISESKKKYPDIFISYYFRDLNNGLWIGMNEKEKFSPASLMKIPVMMAVYKEAQRNPGLLDTKIKFIKKEFENVEEESGFTKIDGMEYTVNEYIDQMIQYSDNVASLILVNVVGEKKVEKVENDLNLHIDMSYNLYTNFVSIKAYASIFRVLYNGSYLSKEMSEKALKVLTSVIYDKGIRAAIPAKYIVAQKYGKRDVYDNHNHLNSLQLHNFGIVYYPGKPFLIGIMTRGSTIEVKEKIVRELTAITFEEFEKEIKESSHEVVFKE